MALQLSKSFKGTTLMYHKIVSVVSDVVNGKTNVVVASYVDQATRDANPQNSLKQWPISLEGLDQTRPEIYTTLKTLPDFSGATDA